MIEFEYREQESGLFGKILRPVADVYFVDKEGNKLISFMYIDSGADITLIPRQLGESLGFTVEEDKIIEIGGIGDAKVPVLVKTAKVLLGDKETEIRIAWALIEEVPPLLGRTDVFDIFKVVFDQKNRKIEFSEYEQA